ncbi:MAG TPA: hypothetical protein VIK18_04975, partial [Pirellulales bacterium]
MNKQPLHERLAAHNQQHVLRNWERWTDEQRRSLAAQIAELDLDALEAAFRGQGTGENWAELAARASAPP